MKKSISELEKEILKNIKLKDRLDYISRNVFPVEKVENPVERLTFHEVRKRYKKKTDKKTFFFSYNFWLFLLVVFLISSSILFNSLFVEKYDRQVFKSISTVVSFPGNVFSNLKNSIIAQLSKPYVVTIGEYGNFGVAKDEAIKLLPQFKQIDIKKLKNGIYTFEIERFSSKEKAYSLAKEFTLDGLDGVHVRYLPDQ